MWRPRRAGVLSGEWRPAVGGVALRRTARGTRDCGAGEEILRPASKNSAPVRTGERRCSVADRDSVADRVSGDILIVTFDLTAEVVFVLGCSGLLPLRWALFLG